MTGESGALQGEQRQWAPQRRARRSDGEHYVGSHWLGTLRTLRRDALIGNIRNRSQVMSPQQLLGTQLPIIEAPMAGSQGSALAVADAMRRPGLPLVGFPARCDRRCTVACRR